MRSVIFDKYTSLKTLCSKIPVTKLPKKPCFATVLFYSAVKIKIVSVTSEKIRYFFTAEKYQFYSHLICIEFTACDKIIWSHSLRQNYFIFIGYLKTGEGGQANPLNPLWISHCGGPIRLSLCPNGS